MQCKHWVQFLEILGLLECLCARQQQLGLILHAFFIWLAAVCQLCHESFHHSFISSGSSAVQLPSWHQWVNGQLALHRFDALPRTLSPVAGRLFFESSLVYHAVRVCVVAIKRYSNAKKKCDSFLNFANCDTHNLVTLERGAHHDYRQCDHRPPTWAWSS